MVMYKEITLIIVKHLIYKKENCYIVSEWEMSNIVSQTVDLNKQFMPTNKVKNKSEEC